MLQDAAHNLTWSPNGTKKLTVKLDLQNGPSPCSTLVTTWSSIQISGTQSVVDCVKLSR